MPNPRRNYSIKKHSKSKKGHKYASRSKKSFRMRIKTKGGNRSCKQSMKGGDISERIPRIVHQIWFGSSVPSWRQYIFDTMREISERNGYKYKLWIESDRTKENFPTTYAYQADALIHGENTGQNRYAQVADLARLEIIYRYGGIYLDSIFLVNDNFFLEIEKMNLCENKTFICANEDPCGLDCANGKGEKYLSNSFFAATKGNNVLKRLLDTDEMLDNIDLGSTQINKTTGPYYIRKGIIDPVKQKVGLIETERIYPFPMSGSVLRENKPNICLSNTNVNDGSQIQVAPNRFLDKNCMSKLPPNTLAVYLVGLGGSWST